MKYYQYWIRKYGRLRIGYARREDWLLWPKLNWFIYFSKNEHWNYDLQEVDFKYIQFTILGFQVGYCYSGKPPKN